MDPPPATSDRPIRSIHHKASGTTIADPVSEIRTRPPIDNQQRLSTGSTFIFHPASEICNSHVRTAAPSEQLDQRAPSVEQASHTVSKAILVRSNSHPPPWQRAAIVTNDLSKPFTGPTLITSSGQQANPSSAPKISHSTQARIHVAKELVEDTDIGDAIRALHSKAESSHDWKTDSMEREQRPISGPPESPMPTHNQHEQLGENLAE
ncbi:hypothetical protein ACLOJK_014771 [Asimina triloba]